MLGWGVVALKRGEYQVAQGRLARARELAGDKPAPPLWYWAATLASAGLDDPEWRPQGGGGGRRGPPRRAPCCGTTWRCCASWRATSAGAETMLRAALAEDPSLPQISKNLADILYRNGRYEEAREAYERAAKLAPDLGDDLYFKLGNIAYKRRDHDRARESWRRATELNPGHELARANLDMLDISQ